MGETPQEPWKSIAFAATPETVKTKTPTVKAYRDAEDQETFDLNSVNYQCRSYGSNKNETDTTKCNEAAAPMECTFAVTCTLADGSTNVAHTFSYTANDASQNALKSIDFTTIKDKSLKNLAMCQFAATTPQPIVNLTLTLRLTAIFKNLLVFVGLAKKVEVFLANSTKGTTFLIDNLRTTVTKCHIG